jgi:hypothetical protein
MPALPEPARSRSAPTAGHACGPGPVDPDWLAAAARLSGKSLHLGVALVWLAGLRRAPGVRLTRRTLEKWSVSRDASDDGLRRLEAAGLVRVWRLPGRAPHVILLEPGEDRPLDLGRARPLSAG